MDNVTEEEQIRDMISPTAVSLEFGDTSTIKGLIEVLKTFPPDFVPLINQHHRIATVDGREGVVWLCDKDNSPMRLLFDFTILKVPPQADPEVQ